KHRCNNATRAGVRLAVGLHGDTAAQIVKHQGLVRLRESQLPGQARMFDAGLWRSSSPAVMAADQNHICMTFGNARCNGSDTDFRTKLYANARVMIGVLEIMDQLRQIFDGIDVVVRRWGNQASNPCRVAGFSEPWIDFSPGQLPTFSRRWAPDRFYFKLPPFGQVVDGSSKT